MPTEDEIFAAVHGAIPPSQSGPRVPGATLDTARWRELQERAQRAASVYQPISFTRKALPVTAQAQAQVKPPAPVFCESCGSQAEPIPPGLWQCKRPSCRRLWVHK